MLVVIGQLGAGGEHAGIVGRQIIVLTQALRLLIGQLGQAGGHGVDIELVDLDGQQIRIWEVAIVVGFFLGAHRPRLAAIRIVQPRLLHDLAAALQQFDLPRDLEVDGFLHEAERVEVLDLGARAELFRTVLPHRHIRVAAERSLLHIAVADRKITHQRMDLLQVGDRFLGRAHRRLRDDLDQRRTGPIQVDAGRAPEALVQRLACIFLKVSTRDVDALDGAVVEHDVDRTTADDRQFVLADLITLRQIGIEVVLAREYRAPRHPRIDRQAEFHRHAYRLGIEHGQHAGIGEIDQIRLRVRRRPIGGGRAGEYFRLRRQLGVNLEPDDGLPFHQANPGGVRRCQSVSSW